MNQIQRFSASFLLVLLLGGLLFIHQTRQLDELRGHPDSPASGRLSNTSQPASTLVDPIAPTLKPDAVAPAGDLAAEFIESLKKKLAATIDPELFAGYISDGGRLERITLAAKLSDDERVTLEKQLKQFEDENVRLSVSPDLTPVARAAELSALKSRRNDWLAAQFGKERAEAIVASDEANDRAQADRSAALAVSRLSEILDLTATQKEELLTGLAAPDFHNNGETPLFALNTYGKIEMEPPVPDLSEEAAKLLTPDQLPAFQKHQELYGETSMQKQKIFARMMGVMGPALEEFLLANP